MMSYLCIAAGVHNAEQERRHAGKAPLHYAEEPDPAGAGPGSSLPWRARAEPGLVALELLLQSCECGIVSERTH